MRTKHLCVLIHIRTVIKGEVGTVKHVKSLQLRHHSKDEHETYITKKHHKEHRTVSKKILLNNVFLAYIGSLCTGIFPLNGICPEILVCKIVYNKVFHILA